MACNNCGNDPCTSTCSCLNQVPGKCVFYQGANLTCLDVKKGDDYDSILANLNTLVCDLVTPTGLQTTLTGCGSITVTQTTATNYNVCLSSSTQNQIDNNTTNISTLSACVESGVNDIVSDTLDITDEALSTCGRTLRIEIPTPSGTPTYDGIITNYANKTTYTNTIGDKILISFNHDYVTNNAITQGDEIRFSANGQILGDGTDVDNIRVELFDATGAIVLQSNTFKGFPKTTKQSWTLDATLTVGDVGAGDGLYSLVLVASGKQNGTQYGMNNISQMLVNSGISGIDYSNLTIRVIYEHNSTTADTDNFARRLMVEVRKMI